jgi:hypothetical protein
MSDNCILIVEAVVLYVVNIIKFVVHQIVLHHPEGGTTEDEGSIPNVLLLLILLLMLFIFLTLLEL